MPYCTVELIFKEAGESRKYANRNIKTQSWLFLPNYLGRLVRTMRVGAMLSTIKPKLVIVMALKAEGEYQVVFIKKTETVFF